MQDACNGNQLLPTRHLADKIECPNHDARLYTVHREGGRGLQCVSQKLHKRCSKPEFRMTSQSLAQAADSSGCMPVASRHTKNQGRAGPTVPSHLTWMFWYGEPLDVNST